MIRVTIRASGALGELLRGLMGPEVDSYRNGAPDDPSGAEHRDETSPTRRPQLPRSVKAYKSCPRCHSWRISLSRHRTPMERFLSLLGIHWVRCAECGLRFTHHSWHWDFLRYARCPKCANLRLHDWQEEYHLPPAHLRALMLFGARQQRCNPCRHNFVSFRARWKPTNESLLALLEAQQRHAAAASSGSDRQREDGLVGNER